MAKSCWALLGIKKSATEREIKIAYAKRLKTTRPDEDPAAFQLLVEARADALRYASLRSTPSKNASNDAAANAASAHVEPVNSHLKFMAWTRTKAQVDNDVGIPGKIADPTDAEVRKATDRLIGILGDRYGAGKADEFDKLLPLLQQASFAQRQSSEAALAWDINNLLEAAEDIDRDAYPNGPLGIAGEHVALRLAAEFGWLEDEHRLAELAGGRSSALVRYLHEIHYGEQPVISVRQGGLTWVQKIPGTIVLVYLFAAIGLAAITRLVHWLSHIF
jgi:hypothetical protein